MKLLVLLVSSPLKLYIRQTKKNGEDTSKVAKILVGQFAYTTKLPELMTPQVMAAIGDMREHKGKQALYEATHPDILESLVEVAKIQSTDTSNRIENISTSDKRLRDLMADKVAPRNRDEREIAGYRYVLDLIHGSYDSIPISPNIILQLHRDLYRFSEDAFAGRWKDSDNVIAERAADGELVARFRPTSAAATPAAIERICEEYRSQLERGTYDPLLIALMFAFDFVSIHPFNDGNGRMSRLLTLLLLYKGGYTVGKYVSVEKEIERTKETYYEVLAASSIGWQSGENDYTPFVTYMLGVLTACYKDLDERVALVSTGGNNEEVLRNYFKHLLGTATKYDILDANPSMSKRTIERLLKKFQEEGFVQKVGAARSTAYKVVR